MDDIEIAGVLPLMIDPASGCVYALLGKGRTLASWAGSGAWGAFAGRRARGEDGCDAAAREFVEETGGMVRWRVDERLPRRHWADIAAALRARQCVCVLSTGRTEVHVLLLPWQPAVAWEFSHVRGLINSMRKQLLRLDLSPTEAAALHPPCAHTRRNRAEFLLRHPAVVSRLRRLPLSVVHASDPAGRQAVGGTAVVGGAAAGGSTTVEGDVVVVPVIESVAPEWLEMSELALFSLSDLRAALADGTLPSRGRGALETVNARLLPLLEALLKDLTTRFPWIARAL